MIRFSSEWLSFFPHPAWTALAASNPRLFRSHQCGFDDIGYVKQSPEEAEVLFTLIAERYERRSMLITSNLVFSDWERIFKDPMATAAAIDRLVHHAVILEFNVPSFARENTDGPSPTKPSKTRA